MTVANQEQVQEQKQSQEQEPAQASNEACEGRPMNHYEQRQEMKRERLLDAAETARGLSQNLHKRAHDMAEIIPFGQPILVGHHSEKADRRYRGRIHSTFERSFEASKRADDLERRAANIGQGGISSDDPNVIDKLREQLTKIETEQAKMKVANAAIRKGKTEEAKISNLVQLGFSQSIAGMLIQPDFCGRVGFPSYKLTNNNANGRRIRERIAQLEQASKIEAIEIEGKGYEYREDPEENRVMFVFPCKPDRETRDQLKGHAFKWSPTRDAWVRQLTNAGIWAGKRVREYLDARAE